MANNQYYNPGGNNAYYNHGGNNAYYTPGGNNHYYNPGGNNQYYYQGGNQQYYMQDPQQQGDDEDSSLNLRTEPSPAAEILMRLFRHQKLIVLENAEVDGWVKVKTDAVEGYVMLSFLQEVK